MAQTTPPSITAAPIPVPQRNDRTTFSTRVDNFVTWLTTAVTQFGNVATNVYGNAVDAYNSSVASAASAVTAATQVTLATTQAGIATTQATNAADSALTALNAPGTTATSTTSLTIAPGTHALDIQTGKSIVVGMWMLIARTSAPTSAYMYGIVTSYTSGTGAIIIDIAIGNAMGAGTYTDWTLSLTAVGGASSTTSLSATSYFIGQL